MLLLTSAHSPTRRDDITPELAAEKVLARTSVTNPATNEIATIGTNSANSAPDSIQGRATCRCFSLVLSECQAQTMAAREPLRAGTDDRRMALMGRSLWEPCMVCPPLAVMPLLLLRLRAVPCSMLLMMTVVQGWKLKKDRPRTEQRAAQAAERFR